MRCCQAFPVTWLLSGAVVCAAASEEDTRPEALLPADAVVYLRFDGLQPHRAGWNRTVLGELLRDELRPLAGRLAQAAADAIGPEVLSARLLAGAEPDQLLELKKHTDQLPRLLDLVNRQGFAAALEYTPGADRGGQATVVFPDAAGALDRDAIFGAVRLLAHVSSAEVSQEAVDGRDVLRVTGPEAVSLACWTQGEHVVLTYGTRDIEHTLDVIRKKRADLTASRLLARSTDFDDYETYLRGFVDLSGLLSYAQQEFPPAEALATELGLTGLKSLSVHVGFDGPHQRSTWQVEAPAPRAGLMQLLSAPEELGLGDLPPLPPDASSIRCAVFDVGAAFEEALKAQDAIARVTEPDSETSAAGAVAAFERGLGIDLRKDLLAHLGPRVLTYSSSSEGPFVFGMTMAVEVRDADEVLESLHKLVPALSRAAGGEVTLDKRPYHGVELHMLKLNTPGFVFTPTFAVVDRWLVAGIQPQPVQGFVLRSQKGYSRWQPPEVAADVLRKVKERRPEPRVTGLTVIDPRPTVASIASFAPLVVSAVQSFAGGEPFDTSLIPNAQAVTEPLTHNVTVVSDDGELLRIDSWASLPIPFPMTGMETYFATLFLSSGFLFLSP
ncbi:MAG TPA: hypothetical protein VML55_04980 [Planctomycetaceae bacterium]|nr:hypothetical protein [Planctomycetaceae bacterium]